MSAAEPIRYDAPLLGLGGRVRQSTTVAASPAAATETIIASLTFDGLVQVEFGVIVIGFAAYTVGTNGVSVNLKLRKTDASGATLKATGAVTAVAANLGAGELCGVDTSPVLPNQVYVLTMTVASGSASSAVSAVELLALAF